MSPQQGTTMRRRKILLPVRGTSFLGRRKDCLGLGGVGLRARRGLPVVSDSRTFINWWRSLVFLLNLTEPGVFHFAPRRGVSFLPDPSSPKRWKGDFFFILSPRPWNVPHRWIYDSPPAVPFSLADRFSNLCAFLDKLNEKPYDCKELTEERLLSHFGLSP
ncbi:UNVERIFIED_CONTAM: hypothetical protein Sradi_6427100 [Sesamum radiatum]|uniref:Uncharacterized protein n=1 Tax=Sesamum radiatum TaxID=300843 RepID=A0AAW2K543_SESRA